MKWFIRVLQHYADFSGRARRKEYWSFVGLNMVVSFAVALLTMIAYMVITGEQSGERLVQTISSVSRLYFIVLILPAIAVAVRRLHDLGKSGWMLLVGLIPVVGGIWLLVLMVTEGQAGDNKYGHDPKTHPETFGESVRLKNAGITVTVATTLFILLYIFYFVIRQIEYSSHEIPFNAGSFLMFDIPNLAVEILFLCIGILLVNAKSIREVTGQRKTVPVLLLASMSIGFILTACNIFKMIPNIQDTSIPEMYRQQMVFNFIYSVFSIFFQLSVIWFAVSLLLKRQIRIATTSMVMFVVLRLLFAAYSTEINVPNTPDETLQWMLSHFYILAPVNFLVLAVAFYPRKENVGEVHSDDTSRFVSADVSTGAWDENRANGSTYHSRKARTLLQASEILRGVSSIPPQTYYVIDTPDGSIGRDIWGFYTVAPLKTIGLNLETDINKIDTVQSLSLTAFGDAMKSQSTVAQLKSLGQYATLILQMECGHCGYKSPVETKEGKFERQCYACGTVNKVQRGTINVMTPSGFIKI